MKNLTNVCRRSPADSQKKERTGIAQGEANRLIRLITELLDIEKLEAGKFILDISEVKLIDLFEIATAAVAQLAEARQLKLETTVPDHGTLVSVDRDRICQVLINLLSNAIKYSPENSVISLNAAKVSEEQIKISVSDYGRGIPEELRLHVFDRFTQVEKTDSTEKGGTGLGLTICKAIVEQHAGQIGVDSTVGLGSTFWFSIPQSITNSEMPP